MRDSTVFNELFVHLQPRALVIIVKAFLRESHFKKCIFKTCSHDGELGAACDGLALTSVTGALVDFF